MIKGLRCISKHSSDFYLISTDKFHILVRIFLLKHSPDAAILKTCVFQASTQTTYKTLNLHTCNSSVTLMAV